MTSSLESLQVAAQSEPLLLAGNVLSPTMIAQLGRAEVQPVEPLRSIGLGADGIAGTPLWLRAEPGEDAAMRSEEHTSELQSLMRISYAVFCLKKKKQTHK